MWCLVDDWSNNGIYNDIRGWYFGFPGNFAINKGFLWGRDFNGPTKGDGDEKPQERLAIVLFKGKNLKSDSLKEKNHESPFLARQCLP
jgi:hypothetical protein